MSKSEQLHPIRRSLAQARRIVIKVGSGVLVNQNYQLDTKRLGALVESLDRLLKNKTQTILVSSGAIAAGAPVMGLENRPQSIPQKQACAAAGQSRLMALYESFLADRGHHTAQILLTQDDVRNRERYLNAKNTIETLLSANILPIVNENDTVAVEEIKFGDNDNLSAQVAALVQADLLLILSSVNGLYDKDPNTVGANENPISVVKKITEKHFRYARDEENPVSITTGGMKSKLIAIQKASQYGVSAVLANGLRPGVIESVLSGAQEGTLFLPQTDKLSARKHWILHSLVPQGNLTVDSGAARAIVEDGKSLLPVGITAISGDFRAGNAVQVLGPDGKRIATGLTHYSAGEVRIIMGCRSERIISLLGYSYCEEVMHRDNLVLIHRQSAD